MADEKQETQPVTPVEPVQDNKTEEAEEVSSAAQMEISRSGVKSAAMNDIAIQGAKDEVPEGDALPSFFIEDNDRESVEVDILFDRKTGRVTSVSKTGFGLDFTKFKFFGHTVEKFSFSVPTYDDMVKYRQRSSVYRPEAGRLVLDSNQLRNFLIVWHLKEWTLRDRKGKAITLSFTSEGALDAESIKSVYAMSPSILDVVVTLLESALMLS